MVRFVGGFARAGSVTAEARSVTAHGAIFLHMVYLVQ